MAYLEQHLTIDHAVKAMRSGDHDQATSIARALLKRNKKNVDAVQLLGEIAWLRQDHREAMRHYRKCLAMAPKVAHFHFLVGKIDALEGRWDEALRRLDRALELGPTNDLPAEWKAMVLEWRGDNDAAREVIEPYIAAGTANLGMIETRAKLDINQQRYEDGIEFLKRLLAAECAPVVRQRAAHLMGNAYEKLGDYDRAFEAHTEAHRAVARPFDPREYAAGIDRLIEAFDRDTVARLAAGGSRSELPVFIAGLPRAGTTLVEQIIDAHPQAHGAGELRDLDQMVARLQIDLDSTEPYPGCVTDMTPQEQAELAGRYLGRIAALAPSAKRVVNKSLDNWRLLGLIAVLWPAARVIHCRRDPRDTCLSCYAGGISPEIYPYITDLGHLGFVYRQYERLMEHWSAALDVARLDVRYEDLVEDLATHARRLIDFCGLTWDDRCLRFHETKRAVMTLSYDQVRKPIYRSSVGRHRGYERHLAPLMEALSRGP